MADYVIGAHVGSEDPLQAAAARSADTVQIFLGDPQSWKKPEPRDDADALRDGGLPIYVHAPYPMNLASGNNRVRIPSRKTLAHIVEAAADFGAAGVIVHGGSVEDNEDLAVGFERWRKALDSFDVVVPILVENTAGSGNTVMQDLNHYGPLWDAIGDYNVGVCLDTCHAWAAGADMEGAVDLITGLTGGVALVHANDSRDPAGSNRDRHQNLGKGEIPAELLVGVIRAAMAPAIVETRGDADQQAADITWLRRRLSR
ncbi:MAG: deoxyribonuclease IV [Acidimicrobiia bacterium]|nr:MAG: deoxyribonuclease IV [Acidimicrobiia bacterium]